MYSCIMYIYINYQLQSGPFQNYAANRALRQTWTRPPSSVSKADLDGLVEDSENVAGASKNGGESAIFYELEKNIVVADVIGPIIS